MVRQSSSPVASRSLRIGLSGSWLTLTAIQRYLNRSKDKNVIRNIDLRKPLYFSSPDIKPRIEIQECNQEPKIQSTQREQKK